MGKANFTEEFKTDAIKLSVSTHSLYAWIKRYSVSPVMVAKDDQSPEIRRLK